MWLVYILLIIGAIAIVGEILSFLLKLAIMIGQIILIAIGIYFGVRCLIMGDSFQKALDDLRYFLARRTLP